MDLAHAVRVVATYTESDLAAVRRAIATGEKSVQFSDRSVTYRSVAELIQAEERIASALETAATARRRQTYAVACKGFG